MDRTLAAATVLEAGHAPLVPGQPLTNRTIGVWFVLLLILAVLLFLFWGE